MTNANAPAPTYRAEVDGLRAVAVLSVLFFHAGLGISGGYVGVDVFFVISGYLITGLILREIEANSFNLVAFWDRRIRRILPALVVVVVACLTAGWFVFLPLNFKELGQSTIAQEALISNFYFWRDFGYFVQTDEVKPLLHTWSLAVEEQFYLLFPFVLAAIGRLSRALVTPTILITGTLSFGLSVYCSYFHPSLTFYLLPTRAWELLIGAFLAAEPARRTPNRWLNELMCWGGGLAITSAMLLYDRETRFPGLAALLPCAGAAFVISANSPSLTSLGRLLATRPVVFVGLISYSLYLWHWPMLVFANYLRLDPIPKGQRVLVLLASMCLATLSWKFIEMPIRRRAVLKGRNTLFSCAGITTATLIIAGVTIYRLGGLPTRLPPGALKYANGATERGFAASRDTRLKDAVSGNFLPIGASNPKEPVGLLVWGDSHARAVLPIFDILCKEHAIRGLAAVHAATVPLVGYESRGPSSLMEDSVDYNNAVIRFIRSNQVASVVLVANWGGYIDNGYTRQVRNSLLDTIGALRGSGTRIWIMRDVPQYRWNVPQALFSAAIHGRDPEALGLPEAEYRKASRLQDPVFAGLTSTPQNVRILDPTDLFLGTSGLCRIAQGGKSLYSDSEHLTVTGALLLRPLVEPIFESLGRVN